VDALIFLREGPTACVPYLNLVNALRFLNLGFSGLVRANILNGRESRNFAQLALDIPSKVRFEKK
jgi:hypothetical protein